MLSLHQFHRAARRNNFNERFIRLLILICAALMFQSIDNRAAAQTNVLSRHNDLFNTGQNLTETSLKPSNVSINTFGKLFSYNVDGVVYAQPLILTNVTIPNEGVHNVLYVVTAHNSVYAFDADDNSGENANPLWKTNFSLSNIGVSTIPFGDVNSDDVQPEIGIIGTPVIDPDAKLLYVVAATKEVLLGVTNYILKLHALDVTTGAEMLNGPVQITGKVPGIGTGTDGSMVTMQPQWQMNRSGLRLYNGSIYICLGSHGDNGVYHGWLMRYDAATLNQQAVFCVTPNGEGGGIWMDGTPPAIDQNGNLYVSTADGTFSADQGGIDYGDSVLKFNLDNGGLNLIQNFTPFNQHTFDILDQDLGSGGICLLPDETGSTDHPHLLVTGGKAGYSYILDRDNLTGFNPVQDNVVANFSPASLYSCPGYFNNQIYIGGASVTWVDASAPTLMGFSLYGASLSPNPISQTTTPSVWPGVTPSISADNTAADVPASAIIWGIEKSGRNALLRAYSPSDLSNELYDSGATGSRDAAGLYTKFTVPTVANGKVYVPSRTMVSVYGLGLWVPAPTITPNNKNSSSPIAVTIINNAPGSEVHFTTDSTDPTLASSLYTGPLTLTSSCTLRARAFLVGYRPSAITEANFLIDSGPGTGNGLRGMYYPSSNFHGTAITVIDPTINFAWPIGTPPIPNIPPINFSARWTGYVQARSSGNYTFTTYSDDGIRVWLNDQQVINNWSTHREAEDNAQISLNAGQLVKIQIDFYQTSRYAECELFWSAPGIAKQIVPKTQLYAGNRLTGVKVSGTVMVGGNSGTGTVTFDFPSPVACVVSLDCTDPSTLQVPSSVTVPAGATQATFTYTTSPVSARMTPTIHAVYNGVTQNRPMTVRPPGASGYKFSVNPLKSAKTTSGTIYLDGAAGPGGQLVTLISDNPDAVNTTVTQILVPEGLKSIKVTVAAKVVTFGVTANMTASTPDRATTTPLTVSP